MINVSSKSNPLVSIIVLNYNGKQFLDVCLSSLLESNYPNYEVIFVDNCSTDGSYDFVQTHFKSERLRMRKLDNNYGFSVGNNIGAESAKGSYLVFLNPDTKVDSEWLDHLVYVLDSDQSIGVAQPKLLLMDKLHFDSAGGFINPYGLVSIRGAGEKDVGQYEQVSEIFYAKGATLIIRRDLWQKLGGFDPTFFTYFEETDLCWRAHKFGQKVVYVPKSIVYHAGGGVLNDIPYHVKYHEAKGRLTILVKNHSLKNVFRYVPLTICMHLFNIVHQLYHGHKFSSLAICKATFWCVFNFRKMWVLRQKLGNSLQHYPKYELFLNWNNSNPPKFISFF